MLVQTVWIADSYPFKYIRVKRGNFECFAAKKGPLSVRPFPNRKTTLVGEVCP
jgi:hypothetical protein